MVDKIKSVKKPEYSGFIIRLNIIFPKRSYAKQYANEILQWHSNKYKKWIENE